MHPSIVIAINGARQLYSATKYPPIIGPSMGINVNIITIVERMLAASLPLAISLTIALGTTTPTEPPSP